MVQHMYWLDLILAVPAIGIRYVPDFFYFETLAEEVYNTIKLFQKTHGTINMSHSPLNYSFSFENGFGVKILHDRIVVDFSYVTHLTPSANSVEVFKVKSKINLQNRYTNLLGDIMEITEKIIQKIANQLSHKVKILRLGIIANCDININLTPPGLTDYVQHLFRPWSKTATSICQDNILLPEAMLEVQMSPILKTTKNYTDRLYLTVQVSENIATNQEKPMPHEISERIVKLILDWQRIYKEPTDIKTSYLKELHEMKTIALEEFTIFATGDLDY